MARGNVAVYINIKGQDGASGAIDRVSSSMRRMHNEANASVGVNVRLQDSFLGLKSGLGQFTAKAGVMIGSLQQIKGALQSLTDVALEGERALNVSESFARIVPNAAEALAAAQKATHGLVEETDLEVAVSRLTRLGVEADKQQKLLELATKAALDQQRGIKETISVIEQAMRGRTTALAQIGVNVDRARAIREYAEAHNLLAAEMDETQQRAAVLEGSLNALDKQFADVDLDDFSTGLLEIKTSIGDLWSNIEKGLAGAAQGFVDWINDTDSSMNEWELTVRKKSEGAANAMADFRDVMMATDNSLADAKFFAEFAAGTEVGEIAQRQLDAGTKVIADNAKLAEQTIDRLREKFGDAFDARKARAEIDKVIARTRKLAVIREESRTDELSMAQKLLDLEAKQKKTNISDLQFEREKRTIQNDAQSRVEEHLREVVAKRAEEYGAEQQIQRIREANVKELQKAQETLDLSIQLVGKEGTTEGQLVNVLHQKRKLEEQIRSGLIEEAMGRAMVLTLTVQQVELLEKIAKKARRGVRRRTEPAYRYRPTPTAGPEFVRTAVGGDEEDELQTRLQNAEIQFQHTMRALQAEIDHIWADNEMSMAEYERSADIFGEDMVRAEIERNEAMREARQDLMYAKMEMAYREGQAEQEAAQRTREEVQAASEGMVADAMAAFTALKDKMSTSGKVAGGMASGIFAVTKNLDALKKGTPGAITAIGAQATAWIKNERARAAVMAGITLADALRTLMLFGPAVAAPGFAAAGIYAMTAAIAGGGGGKGTTGVQQTEARPMAPFTREGAWTVYNVFNQPVIGGTAQEISSSLWQRMNTTSGTGMDRAEAV